MNKTRIAPWISDEILDKMWDRLGSEFNLSRKEDWSYHPLYYIPYELVVTEYDSDYIYTSFKEDGYIVANQSEYIKYLCNLTQQEYYDLLKLRIKYIEDRPKCDHPDCNEYVSWSGRIYSGYGNGRYKLHFCSKECQLSYKYKAYPDKGIASISSRLKAKRSSFLSRGDYSDQCQFYIGTTIQNKFKYGVTILSEDRIYFSKGDEPKLKNIKIIFEGTRFQLANLEYLIGVDLNQVEETLEFSNLSRFRISYNKWRYNIDYLSNLKVSNWEFN